MPPRPFTTDEIRESYLAFFASKGCTRYPSAPIVPENDPTTLFTVAGMSQFKDMFLGRGTHPFTRATTAQKCLRTNDILNVGRTRRHQTFFEMLGNFSFNDYFKREAIGWAWSYLTDVLQLDPARLSVSVHLTDDDSAAIWLKEIGIPANRLHRLGDADNFWPADAPSKGPEGPGGYCSEIFWDFRTNNDPKDNLASSTGRFVEVWNLVFPQFNVRAPHADGRPNLEALGRTNIDTGMGLERLACVMQGKLHTADTDVLQALVQRVSELSAVRYDTAQGSGPQEERNVLLRRIADHIRAVTMCIADGALPGNTGRGYIIRRLIRRATLDINKLGVAQPRLWEGVEAVAAVMGKAYPEVVKRQDLARDTLRAEETAFRSTLSRGLEMMNRALATQKSGKVFSGDDAFELVTTHGFPKEVIEEMAAEQGMAIDEERFKARWDDHIKVSNTKQAEVFASSALQEAKPRLGATPFVGYDTLTLDTEITLLERDGAAVETAPRGSAVRFALARTPFYAEGGGQVGDSGEVSGAAFRIAVSDVKKDDGLVIHIGEVVDGTARPGTAQARVARAARVGAAAHHSATHLLNAALAEVLGAQIDQHGSKVESGALRFDFKQPVAMTPEQIAKVEAWVVARIGEGLPVEAKTMPIGEAKALGAKAMFGEKYGKDVRVVTMGPRAPVSRELCGGCHVASTSEIGGFRVLKEEATAAGIRRITAVAGAAAADLAVQEQALAREVAELMGMPGPEDPRAVEDLAHALKVPRAELPTRLLQMQREATELAGQLQTTLITASGGLLQRVEHLQAELKRLRKLQDSAKANEATGMAERLLSSIEETPSRVALLVAEVPAADARSLGTMAESLRARRPSMCVILGANIDGKAALVVAVTKDLPLRGLAAGDIIKRLAELIGGRGGGRPELAQAGAPDGARLGEALAAAKPLVLQLVRG